MCAHEDGLALVSLQVFDEYFDGMSVDYEMPPPIIKLVEVASDTVVSLISTAKIYLPSLYEGVCICAYVWIQMHLCTGVCTQTQLRVHICAYKHVRICGHAHSSSLYVCVIVCVCLSVRFVGLDMVERSIISVQEAAFNPLLISFSLANALQYLGCILQSVAIAIGTHRNTTMDTHAHIRAQRHLYRHPQMQTFTHHPKAHTHTCIHTQTHL